MSPNALRLLAMASLSVAAVKPQPELAATAAGVGLVFYLWSTRGIDRPDRGRVYVWGAIAAIAVLVMSRGRQVGPIPDSVRSVEGLSLAVFFVSCGLGLLGRRGSLARKTSVVVGLLGLLIVTGFAIAGEWGSKVGTDPYRAHLQAGSALKAGENPYTDAVTFSNGNPYVEQPAFVEGYPYPPVVLFTYGLIGMFTDPRLVSTIAWLGVVAWLGVRALQKNRESDLAFGAFLLVASAPVWPVVWFQGWTEPLSVALLLAAALAWRRNVLIAGIVLGLALASKQYFVLALPLLLLHRDGGNRKRTWAAVSVAAAALVPFLLLDPAAFMQATFFNLADIGFRPDTQSLSGLLNAVDSAIAIPTWLSFAAGGLVALYLGRRSRSVASFLGGLGLALGAFFFLGLAFPNYWFLALALFAVAVPLSWSPASEGRPRGSGGQRGRHSINTAEV